MAKCMDELKSWPLRCFAIVIGVLSWLCALGLIAFFLGLFLRDLNLYADGQFYMWVFSDEGDAKAPWQALSRDAKKIFVGVCRDFYHEPTLATIHTVPENFSEKPSALLELPPYWLWTIKGRRARGVSPPISRWEDTATLAEIDRDDVVTLPITATTTTSPAKVGTHLQRHHSSPDDRVRPADPNAASEPPLPSVEGPDGGPPPTGRDVAASSRFPAGDSRRERRDGGPETQILPVVGNASSPGTQSPEADSQTGRGSISAVDPASGLGALTQDISPEGESSWTRGPPDAELSFSAGTWNLTDKPASWLWTTDSDGTEMLNATIYSPRHSLPPDESTEFPRTLGHSDGNDENKDSQMRGGPPRPTAKVPPSPMFPSPQPKRPTKTPLRPDVLPGSLAPEPFDPGFGPSPSPMIWSREVTSITKYTGPTPKPSPRLETYQYWGYTQPPGPAEPFEKPSMETPKSTVTKSIRKVCKSLQKDYFSHLDDLIARVKREYTISVEGRLHFVFLLLDLIMVLLNSLFCIASYMLVVGARMKNRTYVVPWVCISGVCVYGSIMYALCHVALEHGTEFFLGIITVMYIVIIIVVLVVHAVALCLVHRFLKNMFYRDRRRPRR